MRGPRPPILRASPALVAALLAAGACSPADGDGAAAASGPDAGGQESRATEASTQDTGHRLLRLASVARGFPAVRDLEGRELARGDFAQWVEGGRLHLRIRFRFDGERTAEETAVLSGEDGLVQESWSWDESRGGRRYRRFEVDFRTGTATAMKQGEDGTERWSREIEVEPGRTFAGFAFTLAVAARRQSLTDGETVELRAVAFTPEPRVADVEVSHGGSERLSMGGRTLRGDRFDLVPQVPWLAELVVDAPETRIWMTPPPVGFLRSEGPLVEPGDRRVRIDLLPGGESEAATPVQPEPEAGG